MVVQVGSTAAAEPDAERVSDAPHAENPFRLRGQRGETSALPRQTTEEVREDPSADASDSRIQRLTKAVRFLLRCVFEDLPPKHLPFELAAARLDEVLDEEPDASGIFLFSAIDRRTAHGAPVFDLAEALAGRREGRVVVVRLVKSGIEPAITSDPGVHCRATDHPYVDELPIRLGVELENWSADRWRGFCDSLRENYSAVFVLLPQALTTRPLMQLHRAADRLFFLGEEGRTRLSDVEALADLYRWQAASGPELILTARDSMLDAIARFAHG